jgi:carbon starvation protein
MHDPKYMWITCAPLVWLVLAVVFNARLDAAVRGVFIFLVAIVLVDSLRLWYGVLRGTAANLVVESPFVQSRLGTEEI